MVDAKGMELKPCPFCGGEAILEEIGQGKVTLFKVQCKTNHCTEDYGWRSNRQKTIENWNRRYEPPNEPLTLDELRDMDGEAVWVVPIGVGHPEAPIKAEYALVNASDEWLVTSNTDYWEFDVYGRGIIAYRRRPKEGTS